MEAGTLDEHVGSSVWMARSQRDGDGTSTLPEGTFAQIRAKWAKTD
jgi:hypothetical protein